MAPLDAAVQHSGLVDIYASKKFSSDNGTLLWTKFIDSGNHDTAAEVNANQQDVFVAGDCCIVQGAAIGTGSGFIAKLDENGNRVFVKHLTDGETHLSLIFEMTVDNDTQEYSLLARCKTQETLFRW